jgi:hypothetical protein
MRIAFRLAFFISITACLPSQGQGTGHTSCSSYVRCNERGSIALKEGRLEDAIGLFEQQAVLAERADIDRQGKSQNALLHSPYKLAVTAYNNLALAYLKKHEYMWARAWTLVAIRWEKDNQAAQFNLRKIDQQLAPEKWPQTTAGEYVQYAGHATWQSIIVKPVSSGSIKFCFSGLWWGLGEGPSGIGELTATVPIEENRAEYRSTEYGDCRISMHFSGEKLVVQQPDDADCGFGHNVSADGTYYRVSSNAECPPEQER